MEGIIFIPHKIGYFMTINHDLPAFREWQVNKSAVGGSKKMDKSSITNALAMFTNPRDIKDFNGNIFLSFGDGSLAIYNISTKTMKHEINTSHTETIFDLKIMDS